jgi:hypothetical protein
VHFLENHDERRIASVLSVEEHRAAALMVLGLPGMCLLYEGQLTGARIRAPVQLARCPREAEDPKVGALYQELLGVLKNSGVGDGEGRVLPPEAAWEGNPTVQNFLVVLWNQSPAEFTLVVINLASHRGQCRVRIPLPNLAEKDWEMRDLLGPEVFLREGSEMARSGLGLDLPGNGAQVFQARVKN